MHLKTFLCTFSFILFWTLISAQISNIQTPTSINEDGSDPNSSSILDVQSTSKGMLVPRMTTAQRNIIATPATGLLVFDTTTGSFWFFDGSDWTDLSPSKQLADTDNDTKIQVEESADDDTIRFDVAGVEFAKMDGQTFHLAAPGNSLFIGNNAGQNDDGNNNRNTFIGNSAGVVNTSGGNNTFIGSRAGSLNTTAGSNTFIGDDAGQANISGETNTFIGDAAGFSNTTRESNIFIGVNAGQVNTTGKDNTFIGESAGDNNETGSRNLCLGDHADVSLENLINATALGEFATVNASNKVRIGNNFITVIEGKVDWSFPSDGRFKDNVQENVKGLDFIRKLRPVTYNFDVAKFERYVQPESRMGDDHDPVGSTRDQAAIVRASSITYSGFIA